MLNALAPPLRLCGPVRRCHSGNSEKQSLRAAVPKPPTVVLSVVLSVALSVALSASAVAFTFTRGSASGK